MPTELSPATITWICAAVIFFAAASLYCTYRGLRRYIASTTLTKIDRMSGTEFEEYLAGLYKAKGFKVTHCGKSGDFGCDLILSRGLRKTAVQAKRWNSHVSVGAVQQVYAAKAFYGADDCLVITNNFYTHAARRLADVIGVKLIDRVGLTKYINDLKENNRDVKKI